MYNDYTIMYKTLFLNKGLSLERLHSFCLVATALGFNKAAGDNAYKQSQYSKQIADLEKFFGCSLFLRKGKTIELTKEGTQLLKLVNAFFSQLELLISSDKRPALDLVISAGQSVIEFLLSSVIDKKIMSLVRSTSFQAKPTDDCIEDVISYSSHMAIIGRYIKNKDLNCTKVLSSKPVLVYSTKHKNAFYIGDDIRKLAQNPTAMLTGSGIYKTSIERIFTKTKLNTVIEVPTFLAIKAYVTTGNAISYLPEYCLANADKAQLSTHSCKELSKATRNLFLIYRKNLVNQNTTLKQTIDEILINIQAAHY